MPDDNQNQNTPASALSPEARKEIADIVNAAVTSHSKRNTDAIGKLIEEKLAGFAPKPADPPPAPQGDGKSKVTPEMAAMQAKFDEVLKALESEKKRTAELETKRRDDGAKAALRAALKDVRPELQDVAVEYLFNSQKRVTYDESGRPLFTVRRAPAAGLPEEDVQMTLEDGVAHWMKSKEAAGFIPAPTPAGRAGGRNPLGEQSTAAKRGANGQPIWDTPARTDAEKVARAAEMERFLRNQQKLAE
jgi:hypothetical protein